MKNDEKKEIYKLLKSINRMDLICDLLFLRSYNDVINILNMKEWNYDKFQGLLTPTIWQSNYDNVSKILQMPEWDNERFQGLLTSNIWKNDYKKIIQKLYLPYWDEKKYLHLLVPSIFTISISNIENGIKLLKEYNIDQYITNKCLRFKTSFLKNLIEYLIANNIQ